MTLCRTLPLAVILFFALVPSHARADRAAAESFAERGEAALKEKSWAAAQEHYRKALAEDATFLPARYGLAEGLTGAGDRVRAAREFRAFLAMLAAAEEPPEAWTALGNRARARLAEVDPVGVELERIVDKRIADLVDLAERWSTKDPDMARSALLEALVLRPGDAAIGSLLEKLGGEIPVPVTAVWNGRDWSGWEAPGAGIWSIRDGAIVGDATNAVGAVGGTRVFQGDYDVRMEARLLADRSTDQPMHFAMVAGTTRERPGHSLGLLRSDLLWLEEASPGQRVALLKTPPASLPTPFDPKEWTVYELRFRGARLHALVNGKEVHAEARPEWSASGGLIGLRIQNAKVEFRRLEVVPR